MKIPTKPETKFHHFVTGACKNPAANVCNGLTLNPFPLGLEKRQI